MLDLYELEKKTFIMNESKNSLQKYFYFISISTLLFRLIIT